MNTVSYRKHTEKQTESQKSHVTELIPKLNEYDNNNNNINHDNSFWQILEKFERKTTGQFQDNDITLER